MGDGELRMREHYQFEKLVLFLALAVAAIFWMRYIPLLQSGEAVFAEDFNAHWNALSVFNHWPPAVPYDPSSVDVYNAGTIAEYHPYLNPPFFLLLLWPLAFLPHDVAVAVYYMAQLALWLWVLHRQEVRALWPRWAAHRYYLARSTLLGLPILLNTVLAGQTGWLLASIFLYGVAALKTNPTRAGIWLSFLLIKPQIVLPVGVLLLFGRHWRALGTFAAIALALIALSTLIWGVGIWLTYSQTLLAFTAVLQQAELPEELRTQLISFYAGLRLAGVGDALALGFQAIFSCLALGILAWRIHNTLLNPAIFALAAISMFISSAYVLQYEAPIMLIIILLLMNAGYSRPLSAVTRIVVMLALCSGVIVPLLQLKEIPVGALTILALWWQCLCLNFEFVRKDNI
jgi:alpha-1,2-mannosyltransferase